MVPIEQRKLEIESRISIIISMFTRRKTEVLAEYEYNATTHPIHALMIGIQLGIQLRTTKNYSFCNVTNVLEPIACVKRKILTDLNIVNITVNLDFH